MKVHGGRSDRKIMRHPVTQIALRRQQLWHSPRQLPSRGQQCPEFVVDVFIGAVGDNGQRTVLDAALDTAIAPFVTKGAVELFAYHEIQKVAKELAKRYQEGLISVVRQQRDRYEHCIKAQITPLEDLEALRGLLK